MIMNYNINEACKIIGISRSMFYKILKSDNPPPIIKIGSRTLINNESLTNWLKKLENKK